MTDAPNTPPALDTVADLMRHFFGESITSEDPLLIIGAAPDELTESGVLQALRRRLDTLNASVDADTRDADRIRLVLHAAAARLLGVIHRHETTDTPAPDDAPPVALAPPLPPRVHATLAIGGYSRESIEQAARLAAAQGIDPREAIRAAQTSASPAAPAPRPAPAPRVAPSIPAAASEWEESVIQRREQARAVRAVLVFAGVGLVGLVTIGAVVAVLALGGKPGATPAPGPGPSAAATTPAGDASDKEIFPTLKPPPAPPVTKLDAPPPRVGDFGDVLRDFDAASHGLEVDPKAAIERFESAAAAAAHRWVEAKPDALIAAMNSIVEFMYRAGDQDEVLARALAALAAPSKEDPLAPPSASGIHQNAAAPLAWSAGVLTRLLRERDLPSARREQVRDAFLSIFKNSPGPADSDFRSGAFAALASMPDRLIPPRLGRTDEQTKTASQAWRDWADALSALDGKDGPFTQRLMLNTLERLLTASPEPSQDQVVFDAISLLTTRITWRKGDESRPTLVRWFDSPDISSADLQAITSTLATQSAAPGVDYSMVLSIGASDSARAELRDRYAAIWGLAPAASRDALTTQWITAARNALGEQSNPGPGPGRLAITVRDAGLNLAAFKLRSGDVAGVKDLIEAPVPKLGLISGPDDAPILPVATDASWGVKYVLAGHNIPARREILAAVQTPPNAFEADLIVGEAVRGSPAQVRADAAAIVDRFSSSPTIVNSLLRLAPFIPPTLPNTDLLRRVSLGQIPGPRDPTWRVAVRRALVERLLQLAAGQTELGQIDSLAKQLADEYAQFRPRSADENADDNSGSAAPAGPRLFRSAPDANQADTPEALASEFAARLMHQASGMIASGREPLGLLEIQRRSLARRAVAAGQLQRFAASQADIAETLAFICVAEQPTREAQVRAVLQDLDQQRRAAAHVFDQLDTNERAILRLWLLRFGEGQT
ncbi:MAG: hypothetical protein GC200_04035 [Tepidisphaera sp.]|nr:hypothetical protein [Tepidisphaera sp.]